MIPPDVANNLRLLQTDPQLATGQRQLQPTLPVQRIADVLGDLVPGQRLMAEIQALLPNGSYRAVVAQREITLALPFSAKPGDSLELEVVENDGKVALAVVAGDGQGKTGESGTTSAATTLSRTGQLIGDLLGGIDRDGKGAPPAALNGSQPLVETMPKTAADLAPVLKQALTQSGMFYEAHQARWVAGEIPGARLLQEPQGRYSSPQPLVTTAAHTLPADGTLHGMPPPLAGEPSAEMADAPGRPTLATNAYLADGRASDTMHAPVSLPTDASSTSAAGMASPLPSAPGPGAAGSTPAPLPADLVPLVQQQLNALATQTFAWQGQIWPGQQMHWEIEENGNNGRQTGDSPEGNWRTRLKLQLPQLGAIEATVLLRGGTQLEIAVTTADEARTAVLNQAGQTLGQQLETAGLHLGRLTVTHGTPAG